MRIIAHVDDATFLIDGNTPWELKEPLPGALGQFRNGGEMKFMVKKTEAIMLREAGLYHNLTVGWMDEPYSSRRLLGT